MESPGLIRKNIQGTLERFNPLFRDEG